MTPEGSQPNQGSMPEGGNEYAHLLDPTPTTEDLAREAALDTPKPAEAAPTDYSKLVAGEQALDLDAARGQLTPNQLRDKATDMRGGVPPTPADVQAMVNAQDQNKLL